MKNPCDVWPIMYKDPPDEMPGSPQGTAGTFFSIIPVNKYYLKNSEK